MIATVAFAGIEAASDLAPDLDWNVPDLRRAVTAGAALLPLVYAGVAAVALMAVPVLVTPDGPESALGDEFIEEPILGVAKSFDPAWVSDLMQVVVVIVAPVVLIWAASTAMLGLSRHVYVLATNRQIPSWLGKLSARRTPYVAIAGATLIAVGLVIPGDIEVLAGIYAFGATLAIVIAHASILRLRAKRPDVARPFRVPWDVRIRGMELPVPALVGFVITGLAWLSVLVYHDEARWVGGGWMAFGLVGYVVYRKGFEGTSLLKRVEVPAAALEKQTVDVEYEDILVPIFGTQLDDDIVGTAGRLAAATRGRRRRAIAASDRVRARPAVDGSADLAAAARADGACERGARAGALGGGGVRHGRCPGDCCAGAERRRGHRPSGAGDGRGDDRDGR